MTEEEKLKEREERHLQFKKEIGKTNQQEALLRKLIRTTNSIDSNLSKITKMIFYTLLATSLIGLISMCDRYAPI